MGKGKKSIGYEREYNITDPDAFLDNDYSEQFNLLYSYFYFILG